MTLSVDMTFTFLVIIFIFHLFLLQDILTFTDAACSGRRHCVLPTAAIQTSDDITPCPDMITYMEAGYQCIPGTI